MSQFLNPPFECLSDRIDIPEFIVLQQMERYWQASLRFR